MRTRCIDCGLAYDDEDRELECPHEERPREASTTVRDRFLADVPLPE